MVTNAAMTPVKPTIGSVVVVTLPQLPVRSHVAPVSIVVAVQSSVAIQVDTNASVATPSPLSSSMKTVAIMILADEVPVRPDLDPACSIPLLVGSQAVQMVSNTAVAAPNPPWAFVEMVFAPEVIIRAHLLPMALAIAL